MKLIFYSFGIDIRKGFNTFYHVNKKFIETSFVPEVSINFELFQAWDMIDKTAESAHALGSLYSVGKRKSAKNMCQKVTSGMKKINWKWRVRSWSMTEVLC